MNDLDKVLALAEGKTVHSVHYDPDLLSHYEPQRTISFYFTDGTELKIEEGGCVTFAASWPVAAPS